MQYSCSKCNSVLNPNGSCSSCGAMHEVPAPAAVAAPVPMRNNNTADAKAIAGKAQSVVGKYISILLKIVAVLLIGYFFIDSLVMFFRNICDCNSSYCGCPSFFDNLRGFASNILNTIVRAATLVAYSVIIDILSAKSK